MGFVTSFLNGGTQLTASRVSHVVAAGTRRGLISAPTFSVSGHMLTVSSFQGRAGDLLVDYTQDNAGVDLSTFSGVSVSGNSYQGTLVVITDSSAFVESSFAFLPGLQAQNEVDTNVLVLGWLAYPGNSVSLSSSQWTPAPAAREPEWLLHAGLDAFNVPNTLTVSPVDMSDTIVSNPGTVDVGFITTLVVPCTESCARTLRFVGTLPGGCFIRAWAGANGESIGTMGAGDNTLALWSYVDPACSIPKAAIAQSPWAVTHIKVQITVAAKTSIQFGALGVTTEPTTP